MLPFLQINIITIIMSLVLLYQIKFLSGLDISIYLIKRIVYLLIVSGVMDSAIILLSHLRGDNIRFFIYSIKIIYSLSICVLLYLWMKYTYTKLCDRVDFTVMQKFVLKIPLGFLFMVVILSPLTGWCFSYNDNNQLVQGNISFLFTVLLSFFPLTSVFIAAVKYNHEVLDERKKICRRLIFYTLFGTIGSGIQLWVINIRSALPCIAISVMLVFFDNARYQATYDALTHLNCRRLFDSYLNHKIKNIDKQGFYLVVMDVDKFKHINDAYGHTQGDNALIMISDALRGNFKGKEFFVSRFGGDEFTVICDCDENALNVCLGAVDTELNDKCKNLDFNITISSGYSYMSKDNIKTSQQLIDEADAKMYFNKHNPNKKAYRL